MSAFARSESSSILRSTSTARPLQLFRDTAPDYVSARCCLPEVSNNRPPLVTTVAQGAPGNLESYPPFLF